MTSKHMGTIRCMCNVTSMFYTYHRAQNDFSMNAQFLQIHHFVTYFKIA